MAINPRWKTGKRRLYQQRFRAAEAPCGICKGKLGRIHYEEPSDGKHPLSFCIDEIIPVSRWEQAGYMSASACADDPDNIQAAHWICNARKGNKLNYSPRWAEQQSEQPKQKPIELDGNW
jgi:hypothetical protein